MIQNQSDALDLAITELGHLSNMVANLQAFWVALQHGPHNPIMVEDDGEEARLSKEEEDGEGEYVAPPVAVLVQG